MHSDTGATIIADAWHKSHAPTMPLTYCRNLRIARLAYHGDQSVEPVQTKGNHENTKASKITKGKN
jgi:hypothetical protein